MDQGENAVIEKFLGTIVLCIILICGSLSLVQLLSSKIGIKSFEDEVTYVGDYVLSIIIFTALSTIVLLYFVHYYITNTNNSSLYSSGLLFLGLEALSGLLIRLIYFIIMKVLNCFGKGRNIYMIKPHEISWTWIIISLALMLCFFIFQEKTYAFSYLAIALSYLIWIDFSCHSLRNKLIEIKSLTSAYWSVIVLLVICAFASIRYRSGLESVASFVGIILGFILGILCMYAINKKLQWPKVDKG